MASKKIKKARSMMTQEEIKNHVSPFLSEAWKIRAFSRHQRELAKRKK